MRTLSPFALLTGPLLAACTQGASSAYPPEKGSVGQYTDGATTTPMDTRPEPQGPPGTTFFAVPGIHVEVPPGYTTKATGSGIRFTAADQSNWFAFEWDPAPLETFQRVVEGIAGGGELIQSNGATEVLSDNRTAFVVLVLGRYTGRFKEGRYVVMETGHEQGGFMCVAGVTQEDDALFERAKARLMAIMNTIVHVPKAEVDAMLERERQVKQRAVAARVSAINNRSRTREEARARQALMGKALVKVSATSSNSSSGYAGQTTVERFQLCPDGSGLWTYSSDMNVDGKVTNTQGDVYDTGNLHGTSENHRAGTWDVEHHRDGRLMIVIYSPDGSEGSWFYQEGVDPGACTVGGKVFRVSGPGDSYGPECE